MDVLEAAKYFPEGKTHIISKQLTDETLAVLIDALFLKKNAREFRTKEEEAFNLLFEKEIAYQTIKRLAGEKKIPNVIQSEKDWIRYFQLQNQDDQ